MIRKITFVIGLLIVVVATGCAGSSALRKGEQAYEKALEIRSQYGDSITQETAALAIYESLLDSSLDHAAEAFMSEGAKKKAYLLYLEVLMLRASADDDASEIFSVQAMRMAQSVIFSNDDNVFNAWACYYLAKGLLGSGEMNQNAYAAYSQASFCREKTATGFREIPLRYRREFDDIMESLDYIFDSNSVIEPELED